MQARGSQDRQAGRHGWISKSRVSFLRFVPISIVFIPDGLVGICTKVHTVESITSPSAATHSLRSIAAIHIASIRFHSLFLWHPSIRNHTTEDTTTFCPCVCLVMQYSTVAQSEIPKETKKRAEWSTKCATHSEIQLSYSLCSWTMQTPHLRTTELHFPTLFRATLFLLRASLNRAPPAPRAFAIHLPL